MNIDTFALVVATFFGPIAAVQAQQWVSRWQERRNRKLGIFRALMNTRANVISADAVNAFNAVPLEFRGNEEVLGPWRIYFDHLETKGMDPDVWVARRWDLYAEFLLAMSKHLGYGFDFVEIKKKVYSPEAHGKLQSDQEVIRLAVVDLLTGKATLPVQVRTDTESLQRINALQIALFDWLTGKIAPTVKVDRGS
jgi:uncharacterized protein DUF6680